MLLFCFLPFFLLSLLCLNWKKLCYYIVLITFFYFGCKNTQNKVILSLSFLFFFLFCSVFFFFCEMNLMEKLLKRCFSWIFLRLRCTVFVGNCLPSIEFSKYYFYRMIGNRNRNKTQTINCISKRPWNKNNTKFFVKLISKW